MIRVHQDSSRHPRVTGQLPEARHPRPGPGAPPGQAIGWWQRTAGNRAVTAALSAPVQRTKVTLGPLPPAKGSFESKFQETHFANDQPMTLDLQDLQTSDLSKVDLWKRLLILRKLQNYLKTCKDVERAEVFKTMEHVASFVEKRWDDPKKVLELHVPDLADYERQLFEARFKRARDSTTDRFRQDELDQARNHLRLFGWGKQQLLLRDEILAGLAYLKQVNFDQGLETDKEWAPLVADVRTKQPRTSTELEGLTKNINERTALIKMYARLTTEPKTQETPKFQHLIKIHFGPAMEALATQPTAGDKLALLSLNLDAVNTEVAKDRKGLVNYEKTTAQQRVELFGALRGLGMPSSDVPPDNFTLYPKTRKYDKYEVGASRTAWISVRGTAKGQDAQSSEASSALNTAYDLVHANAKFVAAHLVPALLGGRATVDNLVPVVNSVNGWLADNPEKYAKRLVFSEGACIQYQVNCTFNRKARNPLKKEAPMAEALAPSVISVTITRLTPGNGDSTSWMTYSLNEHDQQTFNVPDEQLELTPV